MKYAICLLALILVQTNGIAQSCNCSSPLDCSCKSCDCLNCYYGSSKTIRGSMPVAIAPTATLKESDYILSDGYSELAELANKQNKLLLVWIGGHNNPAITRELKAKGIGYLEIAVRYGRFSGYCEYGLIVGRNGKVVIEGIVSYQQLLAALKQSNYRYAARIEQDHSESPLGQWQGNWSIDSRSSSSGDSGKVFPLLPLLPVSPLASGNC